MKKIRIVSPAKSIAQSKIDFAVEFLESNGHIVEVSRHAAGEHHYFSGSDEERLSDFQRALDDPSLDAILCSRGGYGSVRIIDSLNFEGFKQHPKLILGYSDVTVFHNHVTAHYNLPTVHSTAPLNFEENSAESLQSLLNVLEGKPNKYNIETSSLNRLGEVKAEVIGGNLAILYSLIGTNSDINYDGKMLFIEDIGEAIYSIDRMFWTLKKTDRLENLAGLIVGGMTSMKDSEVPFGKTVEQVIADAVQEYPFPVCFNFPAGHISDNRAIILGQEAQLIVENSGVQFIQ